MDLNNLVTGSLVTARVYKQYGAKVWANNYELQVAQLQAAPEVELLVLAQTLAAWEATFHLQGINIFRVVVSTYERDNVPYNPNSFLTLVVNENGQRVPDGQVMPLEACLFVRRVANFGRNGKLLYRGVLSEGDMAATAFEPLLTGNAVVQFQGLVSAILNNNTFTSSWNFVLAAGNPVIVRNVNFLVVANNIVFKKRNNAYFDRQAGSAGNSGN